MSEMIRKMQIAWMSFWSMVLLGMLAIMIWAYWPQPREATIYAFHLPVMFLGCFHYQPTDGETLADWDFEQPTTIEVEAGHTLTVSGGKYTGCYNEAIFHVLEAGAGR